MDNEARTGNRLPIFDFIHSLENTKSQDETKEINVIVKEKQYRDLSRSKSFDADSTDDSTQ